MGARATAIRIWQLSAGEKTEVCPRRTGEGTYQKIRETELMSVGNCSQSGGRQAGGTERRDSKILEGLPLGYEEERTQAEDQSGKF